MKKTLLLKLIASRKLTVNDGLIEVGDEYFNLLPTIFVSSLTDHFHRREELHKLYLISWFWSYEMAQKIKTELGLEDPEQIYSVGMDFMENQGLGLYQTDNYYPGRYTGFKIETNPYVRHLKPKNYSKPMDYFMAGAMAGGGCHVHEAVTQCVELKCKVQGDGECKFITGTKEELKNREVWEIAKKRYHLDDIIDFQRDIYNNYSNSRSEEFIEKLSDKLQKI